MLLDLISDITNDRDDRMREWKNSHRSARIIGWVYSTPEEIIHAAGLVPYRILGNSQGNQLVDLHLPHNVCAFARCYLDKGLGGDFDFLDGIIMTHNCDVNWKLFDIWRQNVPDAGYAHYLDTPCLTHERGEAFFYDEILKLKVSLEDFTGNEITDSALRESIKLYNRNRALLRELYELRKSNPPKITGVEALKVVISSTSMPKEDHNRLLEEIIDECRNRPNLVTRGARLHLSGTIIDATDILEWIEGLDAYVVSDDLCTGSLYFWENIPEEGDPWRNLTRFYLRKDLNPWQVPTDNEHIDYIKKAVSQFGVDGVIIQTIRYCDPFTFFAQNLRRDLDRSDIPNLYFQHGYDEIGMAHLENRVQSFIEQLRRSE